MIPQDTCETKSEAVKKLLSGLAQIGWESGLSDQWLEKISELPIRGDSFQLAAIATELAYDHKPITLRGLFYRVVSTGYFQSTDKKHYSKLGNLMTTLRRSGCVPYEWIVDNIRSTIKPSSWSGLEDFADTVRDAYRKDFWASLPQYVHVFVEKDAMAGVIEPVTREYDVPLSPVRGYCSDSYAHIVGSQWKQIRKRIHAIYIGDFDPSGFDLERNLREKLAEHSGRIVYQEAGDCCHDDDGLGFEPFLPGEACVSWSRLALNESDFDEFNLYELDPKKSDSRTKRFVERFGDRCAEVDALDPNEIRRRVRDAVTECIPTEQWERLLELERAERETWERTIGSLSEGRQ